MPNKPRAGSSLSSALSADSRRDGPVHDHDADPGPLREHHDWDPRPGRAGGPPSQVGHLEHAQAGWSGAPRPADPGSAGGLFERPRVAAAPQLSLFPSQVPGPNRGVRRSESPPGPRATPRRALAFGRRPTRARPAGPRELPAGPGLSPDSSTVSGIRAPSRPLAQVDSGLLSLVTCQWQLEAAMIPPGPGPESAPGEGRPRAAGG
jgi:hypothetical protein